MKNLITLLALLLFTGCAALNPAPEYYSAQAARASLQTNIATRPLLEIKGNFACAGEGCSLAIYDPRQKLDNIKQGTTAADVAIKGVEAAAGTLTWGIAGYAAVTAVEAVGDKQFNLNNDGGGDINFTQDTNTVSSANPTSGDSSVVTTTTTGDTSGDNISSGDTSGDVNTSGDSYADSYNDSSNHSINDGYNDNSDSSTSSSDNSITNPEPEV